MIEEVLLVKKRTSPTVVGLVFVFRLRAIRLGGMTGAEGCPGGSRALQILIFASFCYNRGLDECFCTVVLLTTADCMNVGASQYTIIVRARHGPARIIS